MTLNANDTVVDPAAVAGVGVVPRRAGALRRLLKDPVAVASIAWLVLVVLLAIFAPLLTSADPAASSLSKTLAGPEPGHPLGFDGVGRDVWARLLYGARISLLGTLLASVVAVTIGLPAGLAAGFFRGWFDGLASWWSNLLMAIPAIILLLVVLATIGQNTYLAMAVFGVLMSAGVYRLTRASVTAVREELYVDAARVSGLKDGRIIRRHILPVVIAPTIILVAGMLGVGILIQSGLEFLGLGSASQPSWGSMLNDAFANIYTKPSLLIWPGLAIVLTVAAFGLLGNSLSDVLVGGRPKIIKHKKRVVEKVAHDERAASVALSGLTGEELLHVEDLAVSYPKGRVFSTVVDGVSVAVRRGEVLGLVGESGSGKSQTAFAILGLLPPEAHIGFTRMTFDGTDLKSLTATQRNALRGQRIAYIPQEPMSNLDPSFKIGSQLVEPVRHHLGLSKADAKAKVLGLLERVGIVDPQRVFDSYPHQVSGGMAQRVLIAGAVSCDPDLLIADEPTTALDVTVQAEVLDLMRSLQQERDMGMIIVTHDFGVVADICDRVSVMQTGRIVESGPAQELFDNPQHSYTRMLLDSTLEDSRPRALLGSAPRTAISATAELGDLS
jgi:peptide/nickel transport system permease protein